MSKSQPFQINWFGAAGSALGAVSAAVLLSTLGAAGTLFGAAIGSLTITVGGSIYTQSLQKTTARVNSRLGPEPPASPDPVAEERGSSAGSTSSAQPPKNATEPPKNAEEKTSKGLPWKRIFGLSVGLFVVAMAIIVAFELSTGRPVSSFTGGTSDSDTGTTFSELGSSSDDVADPDAEEPDGEATGTEQPMKDEPTMDEPTEDKPVEDEPVAEKPVEEKPAEEKPADPPPAVDSDG